MARTVPMPRFALAALASIAAVTSACRDDGGPSAAEVAAAAPPGGAVAAPAPLVGLPDDELVARFGAAVWRVETDGCDWTGSGSAFAVDSHHLVTNHHVIATDVGPDLVAPTGERRHGRVIGSSTAADVAVIEVDEPLPVALQWAPTEAITAGERVVTLGYPAPALAFTASGGEVVTFVGPDGARDAFQTNAPIERGNSGGPALRADGTVAGVVTQMSLDGPTEHAAIVFPTATVQPLVLGFIGDPQETVSDCGYGPDYVPPVPDSFAVLPAPPPPSTPVAPEVATPPTPPTTARGPAPTLPPATTAAVPCPGGDVVLTLTNHLSTPVEGDASLWQVTVDGTVTNRTDSPIAVRDVVASLGDDPSATELHTDGTSTAVLGPEEVASWEIAGTVVADGPPVLRRVDLAYGWALDAHRRCAVPAVAITP